MKTNLVSRIERSENKTGYKRWKKGGSQNIILWCCTAGLLYFSFFLEKITEAIIKYLTRNSNNQ